MGKNFAARVAAAVAGVLALGEVKLELEPVQGLALAGIQDSEPLPETVRTPQSLPVA